MKEQVAVKSLIHMFLDHIGHNSDSFKKRSRSFYKLLQTHRFVSFSVEEEYELAFYMSEKEEGRKVLSLSLYSWDEELERDRLPTVEYKLSEFNIEEAHLVFIKLVEGFQDLLRDRWRKQDFLDFG